MVSITHDLPVSVPSGSLSRAVRRAGVCARVFFGALDAAPAAERDLRRSDAELARRGLTRAGVEAAIVARVCKGIRAERLV